MSPMEAVKVVLLRQLSISPYLHVANTLPSRQTLIVSTDTGNALLTDIAVPSIGR